MRFELSAKSHGPKGVTHVSMNIGDKDAGTIGLEPKTAHQFLAEFEVALTSRGHDVAIKFDGRETTYLKQGDESERHLRAEG